MYFWKIRISYNFGLEVFVAIRTSDGKMHVLIISDDNIRWLCQLHGWLHPTWECQTASPTPSQIQFSRSHSRWKWEIMPFEISFAFLETCRCRRDCARCWCFLHRPPQGFLIQRESSPGVRWLFFRIQDQWEKNLQPVLQQCDEATHCEVTLDPQNTQINSKQFENNFYSPPKVWPLSPLAVFQMPSWSGQRQWREAPGWFHWERRRWWRRARWRSGCRWRAPPRWWAALRQGRTVWSQRHGRSLQGVSVQHLLLVQHLLHHHLGCNGSTTYAGCNFSLGCDQSSPERCGCKTFGGNMPDVFSTDGTVYDLQYTEGASWKTQ